MNITVQGSNRLQDLREIATLDAVVSRVGVWSIVDARARHSRRPWVEPDSDGARSSVSGNRDGWAGSRAVLILIGDGSSGAFAIEAYLV